MDYNTYPINCYVGVPTGFVHELNWKFDFLYKEIESKSKDIDVLNFKLQNFQEQLDKCLWCKNFVHD